MWGVERLGEVVTGGIGGDRHIPHAPSTIDGIPNIEGLAAAIPRFSSSWGDRSSLFIVRERQIGRFTPRRPAHSARMFLTKQTPTPPQLHYMMRCCTVPARWFFRWAPICERLDHSMPGKHGWMIRPKNRASRRLCRCKTLAAMMAVDTAIPAARQHGIDIAPTPVP